MKKHTKDFRLFFYGQPFEDGLRTTFAVLIPALVLSYTDFFELGLAASIGAACVSLSDAPGPIIHRRITMLFCLLFIFLVALLTGFARYSLITMGIEIFILSFFFSMFTVYGNRAMTVGNAALLTLVLTMDKLMLPHEVLRHSLVLAGGGLWYMLISLATYKARPYRPAQRALGESIRELSKFLFIKAEFYNVDTNLDEDYKKLLTQQAIVAEKQNDVREVLYKTRQIVEETTAEGRKLVMAFINTVDLHEDISATYYDYRLLRQQYAGTGLLEIIHAIAKSLATDLDMVGIAILTNENYYRQIDYTENLVEIKKRIDEFEATHSGTTNLILRKMLVNIRRIIQRNKDLAQYFSEAPAPSQESKAHQHTLFVGHQSLDPKLFWNNLNFSSTVFRHALRVAIACILGFLIAKLIARGYHSYWIIMTIIFMLKPSFSATRQRNKERIAGTLIGGAIGFIILMVEPSKHLLFAIMVVLMVATYSLQRVKYMVSIICMTPFILILFHFLGIGFLGLLQERVVDTFTGCLIALLAAYLLFPDWESDQLHIFLKQTLKANTNYLEKIMEVLEGRQISSTEYKLARKEVYVQSANLSTAFQRMTTEPSSKQKNKKEIHQFVVLNHILTSNIASIAEVVMGKKEKLYSEKTLRSANKGLSVLKESLALFEGPGELAAITHNVHNEIKDDKEDELLKEQLDFIHKLSHDIKKTTEAIVAEETIQ